MYQTAYIERALKRGNMKKIKSMAQIIRKRRLFCVAPDDMARHACKVMTNRKLGALPVIDDDGKLVGVISERDIVRRCIGGKRRTSITPISEVMTAEPLFASPDDSVVVATAIMMQNNIRHLPVVREGVVLGTVSIREVIAELTTLAMDNLGLMTMAEQYDANSAASNDVEATQDA